MHECEGQISRPALKTHGPPEMSMSPTLLYRKLTVSANKSERPVCLMHDNRRVHVGISASAITVPYSRTASPVVKPRRIQVQTRVVMTVPEEVKRRNRKLAWEKSVNPVKRNAAFTGKLKGFKTPEDIYESLQTMFHEKIKHGFKGEADRKIGVANTQKLNYKVTKDGKFIDIKSQLASEPYKFLVKLDQKWTPASVQPCQKDDTVWVPGKMTEGPNKWFGNNARDVPDTGNQVDVKRRRRLLRASTVSVHPMDIPEINYQESKKQNEDLARIAAMFCVEEESDAIARRRNEASLLSGKIGKARPTRTPRVLAIVNTEEENANNELDFVEIETPPINRDKKSKNPVIFLYRYLKKKYGNVV